MDINQDFYNKSVRQVDLWVKENDKVSAFRGANDAIGTLVLQFESEEELVDVLSHQNMWFNVIVK